jgi:hypothetical protein
MSDLRQAQAPQLPPLILTEAQLTAVLEPLTAGYAWGAGTIGDLWRCGAPLPNDPTKRIILPSKLMDWLADVLERQGRPLDMAAEVFGRLLAGEKLDALHKRPHKIRA